MHSIWPLGRLAVQGARPPVLLTADEKSVSLHETSLAASMTWVAFPCLRSPWMTPESCVPLVRSASSPVSVR